MLLHWFDLREAEKSLGSARTEYPDEVNRALAQNAIILFYKCFGSSKFRNYPLKDSKILAAYPPEAKKVYEYYKNLRDKYIAHDESRYAQVFTGLILDSTKECPFVDIVSTVAVAETFQGESNHQGLQSFYNLIHASIQWVEAKIDELSDIIKENYKELPGSKFEGFKPLQLTVPGNENMFEKRY